MFPYDSRFEDRGQGAIQILGSPRTRDSLKNIGASINGPAFYGHLSALNNIRVHAKLLNIPDLQAQEALDFVGLGHAGRKKARSFSTGMKARLALATAILGRPPSLFSMSLKTVSIRRGSQICEFLYAIG